MFLAYTLAIFTFTELTIETQLFGSSEKLLKSLTIFKWVMLIFSISMLTTCIFLIGFLDDSFRKIFSNAALVSKLRNYGHYSKILRGLCLVLDVWQATILIQSGIFLSICTAIFLKLPRNNFRQKLYKNTLVRNLALIVAFMFCCINFGINCYGLVYLSGGFSKTRFSSLYEQSVFVNWIYWAMDITELLWISSVAYAMRTSVSKTWIYLQFKTAFSSTRSKSGLKTSSTNLDLQSPVVSKVDLSTT